jgi:isopropylmalate/homocitrate/citramalate synthase
LAAVTAGAEVVHGCVNGLGERTGNAAIEELMVGLHLLLGFDTSYRMDRIGALSKMVRDLSGIHYPSNKPIVGEENYTRESGIGVDLVIKNPLAMFATAPQIFGREGKVVLGKKSGKASITYTLERLGIRNVSDQAVTEILKEVKARGTEKRALLSIDEFKEIVGRKLK